jgi:hypothetical protein
MTSLYGWGFNAYTTHADDVNKGGLVSYLNEASPSPTNTDENGVEIGTDVLIGTNNVRLFEGGDNSPYNDWGGLPRYSSLTSTMVGKNPQIRPVLPSSYYISDGETSSSYAGGPTKKSSMFGGLGIGVDYPLFLGDGKDDLGFVGKRFYSEETCSAGFTGAKGRLNRGNVYNGGYGTCGLVTQVPVPMRLDDYNSSGDRISRENWVKLQATDIGCLGIKSSGTSPRASGQLWGWGQGHFLGGSTLDPSLQYWSNVPEICDSGFNRYDTPLSIGSRNNPLSTYWKDPAGHLAAEYASLSTATFPSNQWQDIGCLGSLPHRGNNAEHKAGVSPSPDDQYASTRGDLIAIKDYKVYTNSVNFSQQHSSYAKWLRQYEVDDAFYQVGSRYYRITIKTSQPLFEKVFANGNGLAGIISSVSGLYLLGSHRSGASSRFLHRIKTSVAGDDGFSWFNSSTLAIAFIQDGDIYYTAKANHAPYNLSYNAKDWGLSQGGLSNNKKLDNTVNAGESLASTVWTQVYCLTEINPEGPHPLNAQGGGVIAINASGEVWFRDPHANFRKTMDDGTPTIGYHNMSTDATVAASANWSMISPKNVKVKKIILSPNHVHHPWGHGLNTNTHRGSGPIEHMHRKRMFAIIALTDNGSMYCSDNTYRNQYPEDAYTFPYVKPAEERIAKALSGHNRNELVQPSGKLQRVKPWESLIWAHSDDHGTLVDQPGKSIGGDTWGIRYRSVDNNPILSAVSVKDITNNGKDTVEDHPRLSMRGKPLNQWTFSGQETGGINNRNYNSIVFNTAVTGGTARLDRNYTFNGAAINDDGTVIAYCHTGRGTSTTPPSGYIDVKYPSATSSETAADPISNWTSLGTRIYVDPEVDIVGRREKGFENAFDMTGHNVADDGTLTGLTMVISTRHNNAAITSSGIVQTYQYNGSDFAPIGSGIEGGTADLLSFVSITRNLQNDGATSGVPSLAVASPSPLNTKYIRTFAYAHDWVPSGVYNDGSNKITKFVPNNMEKHIWQGVSSLNLFLPAIINFDVIYNVKILPGWLFCQVKSGSTMYLLVYKWNDTTFQWVENAVRAFVPFEHVGGTRGGHGEYAVSDFATYKTNGVVNSPKIAISEFNILDTWNIETGEEFKDSNSPRGMPGDGSLKNLSMSADGNYLVAGHNSEDKAATYEWNDLNKWVEINKKRLHRPQDTSTYTYQRASSWNISRNGQCIVTLGANTQYDSSDIDRADREEIKYQWIRQTCLADDFNNGTITFKHPRRTMTIDRDFLVDGQDLHNFYDGWEDLTVTQYPLIPSQTKFWGIR